MTICLAPFVVKCKFNGQVSTAFVAAIPPALIAHPTTACNSPILAGDSNGICVSKHCVGEVSPNYNYPSICLLNLIAQSLDQSNPFLNTLPPSLFGVDNYTEPAWIVSLLEFSRVSTQGPANCPFNNKPLLKRTLSGWHCKIELLFYTPTATEYVQLVISCYKTLLMRYNLDKKPRHPLSMSDSFRLTRYSSVDRQHIFHVLLALGVRREREGFKALCMYS